METRGSDSGGSSDDEWIYENYGLTLSQHKKKKPENSVDYGSKIEESLDRNDVRNQKGDQLSCIPKKIYFFDLSNATLNDPERVKIPFIGTEVRKLNNKKIEYPIYNFSNKSEENESAWVHDDEFDRYYFSSTLAKFKEVIWPYFNIPSKLYNSLYPHQKIGVQWMASMHSSKVGGILADDMGLGKTWSTLTFLAGLMRGKTLCTALIITPTSILRSWEKEALKVICNYGSVENLRIYVFSSRLRRDDRQRILRTTLNRSENKTPCLIISSYGLVSNNPEDFVNDKKGFDYVVLDEAHRIKNRTTKMFSACETVCKNEDTRRLLLTGTPIQNNLKEMWTLFDFATAGCLLGSLKLFMKNFGDPIEVGRNKNATQLIMEQAKKANSDLQAILKPHFLQRMKNDVLSDMPPKFDFVVWTHISAEQRRLYQDYVKNSSIVNAVLTGEKRSPLEAVTWLKKLAGHPLLVNTCYDRAWSSLLKMKPSELLKQSAKLEILYGLVKKLSASGHRTLIFSGSTMMLDIIQRVLIGLKILRIDGSTKEEDRQRHVEDFNAKDSQVSIMLLSTKAGGLGLTLTGADRAIIYDPSWNPTDDSQAVDRCYRIGQQRPVEVYRFIAAGTVEEKMYEKQMFKDGIRRVVTTSLGSNTHRYFDKDSLGKLFCLSPPGECTILQKLREENRIGDINTTIQNKFFEGHKEVIGLSSHEAVYKETTGALSVRKDEAPFSGNTRAIPHKAVGKSQRILQNTGPKKCLEKKLLRRSENIPISMQNNFLYKYTSLPKDSSNFQTTFGAFEKKIEVLKNKGRNEEALSRLLNLVEGKINLTKVQKLWLHKQCSTVSTSLGWL